MRTVSISEFKSKCLGMVDEVARTGETLVLTKRGREVARVVPVEPPASLLHTVEVLVSDDELVAPTGEAWDVDRADLAEPPSL